MCCEQVFDKALGEPNFSGIYARLCYDLNQVLPSFKVVDEDGKEEDVEFRRVLLNKCQLEFEEGGAAMRAVEAREKRQQEENAAMVRLPLDPNLHCDDLDEVLTLRKIWLGAGSGQG